VSFFPFTVAFNDKNQASFGEEIEFDYLQRNTYQYDTKEMLAKFTFRYRPLGKRDQPEQQVVF
jgi:hypothetical protein